MRIPNADDLRALSSCRVEYREHFAVRFGPKNRKLEVTCEERRNRLMMYSESSIHQVFTSLNTNMYLSVDYALIDIVYFQ
jgi:hypothetical protein